MLLYIYGDNNNRTPAVNTHKYNNKTFVDPSPSPRLPDDGLSNINYIPTFYSYTSNNNI